MADSKSKRSPDAARLPTISPLETAKVIPLSLIDPIPFQPRHDLRLKDVAELADSIKANGPLEPLPVCPKEDRFYLIARLPSLDSQRVGGTCRTSMYHHRTKLLRRVKMVRIFINLDKAS